MTNELEPCPFCGGKATVMESPDGFTSVGCANDGCPTTHMVFPLMFSFSSKEKAIKAWNTRYKRTCRLVVDDHIRLPFESFFRCSECGERIQNKPFCPSCGAEVVDG